MSMISDLVERIDAYAVAVGKKPSTISRLLFSEGAKIESLRNGGQLTIGTYEHVTKRLDALEAALSEKRPAA